MVSNDVLELNLGELLSSITTETTQGHAIFISAIKSSKGFKFTKVSNYLRTAVSKSLWQRQWVSKDNGLLTCHGIIHSFLWNNSFLFSVSYFWLTMKYSQSDCVFLLFSSQNICVLSIIVKNTKSTFSHQ